MKKNDIEKILLNDENYENMLKQKFETDFKNELKNAYKNKTKYLTDIKLVPAEKLFSKDAIFEVLNKASKTCTYINGVQAEGYLGIQNSDREKLLTGQSEFFVSGDCFIKFIKAKV